MAIELPTGAGKTLVGGLLGDFRRRTARERVAYLCPTRQLARQTSGRLSEYGIPNVLLVGKTRNWNRADRARYTNAQAVAVTVYHHVFNSNPGIDDAEMLVLDDAHAAEQAVASPWSLRIDREDGAYLDVLSVLREAVDPLVLERLRTEHPDGQYRSITYLASPLGVSKSASELEAALRTAAEAGQLSDSAQYSLIQLEGRLDRCMVYLSYRGLLLRPLITPTAVHPAFDQAARRLYMSATLGAGGELERAFGRRRIHRIPIPRGWDRQGTGRRFFCFPELNSDLAGSSSDVPAAVGKVISQFGRSVILTPDERTAQQVESEIVPSGSVVRRASDVEDDLSAFTGSARAVLLLTNRYDGIDLPDNDCRLVIINGLPARGDLQERFLYGALGAMEVLQERIRARFVQGAGRATRNAKDYAAVLVLDPELTNYLQRREVQSALHPDVQAELAYGVENSLANTSAEVMQLLQHFLDQSEEWAEANEDIVIDREQRAVVMPAGTDQLAAAAGHEVEAWQAAWQGDWDRALIKAREVVDALSGSRNVQRYAALWNYLAGCWTLRAAHATEDVDTSATASQYLRAARAAGRGTTWLDHLVAPSDEPLTVLGDIDPADRVAAEAIAAGLDTIGRAIRFEPTVTQVHDGLMGTDPVAYESALVTLGTLAGALSVGNGGASAAPDAAWRFDGHVWVSWEAKSDAQPAGEVGANTVRQAGSHLRYMADEHGEDVPVGSIGIMMTPQDRVHPAARAIAEDHVYLTDPEQVLELLGKLRRAWRKSRAGSGSAEDVFDALHSEGALPSQWLSTLPNRPIAPRDGA